MAKNNTKQVKIEDVLELKKVEDNQNKEIENKKEDKANAPLTSVFETKNTDEKPVKVKKEPAKAEEAKEPEEVKNISLANKGKNISSKTAKKSTSKIVAQSSENKKEKASKKKKDLPSQDLHQSLFLSYLISCHKF